MNIINNSRVIRQSKLETEYRDLPDDAQPLKMCLEIVEDFGNALQAVFESAAEHKIDLTEIKVALAVDPNVTPNQYKLVFFAQGLGDENEVEVVLSEAAPVDEATEAFNHQMDKED